MIRKTVILGLSVVSIVIFVIAVWSYFQPVRWVSRAVAAPSQLPKWCCVILSGEVKVTVSRHDAAFDAAISALWFKHDMLFAHVPSSLDVTCLRWVVKDYMSYHPEYEEKKRILDRYDAEAPARHNSLLKITAAMEQGQVTQTSEVFGVEISKARSITAGTWFRVYQVSFPIWYLIVVCSIVPVIAFIRAPLLRSRRRRRNQCVHCGYSLTGNVSGVCPECGRKVEG
jgi:hypothetical protein